MMRCCMNFTADHPPIFFKQRQMASIRLDLYQFYRQEMIFAHWNSLHQFNIVIWLEASPENAFCKRTNDSLKIQPERKSLKIIAQKCYEVKADEKRILTSNNTTENCFIKLTQICWQLFTMLPYLVWTLYSTLYSKKQ